MIFGLWFIHTAVLWVMKFVPSPEFLVYPYLQSIGLIPYTQIIDHHFPGISFWPINFWQLGFTTPVAFKVLLIMVVLWQSAWIYKISKNIWAVLVYTLWQPFFAGSMLWYDLFIGTLTLPAVWALENQAYVIAGVLLGSAVVIKQSSVLLIGFAAVWLLWKLKKHSLWPLIKLSLGTAIPVGLMIVWVLSKGIWIDFWYWNIDFNLNIYSHLGIKGPTIAELFKLLLPLVILIVAGFGSKAKRYLGWGLFSLVGGLTRFGFEHFQPALPFFALVVGESWQKSKKIALICIVLSVAWIGKGIWQPNSWGKIQFYDFPTLELQKYIQDNTDPGDPILLLGPQPHLYPLTKTRPAGNMFVFPMPWLLRETEDSLVQALQSDLPKLIVYDPASQVDEIYLVTSAPKLLEYIAAGPFDLIATVGGYLIYAHRD